VEEKTVQTLIPVFDEEKCVHCRKCVDFCQFHALAAVGKKHMVFPDVCHSCGGCKLVCPTEAISETGRTIGTVEIGKKDKIITVTGLMNLGEASGVPIIKEVLMYADYKNGLTVIDCPPGSACTVTESIQEADYCVLVAEPTSFGLHNFKMVYELVSLLKLRCGVIINKCSSRDTPMDAYCKEEGIPVLARIPYGSHLAREGAKASIAVEQDEELKNQFANVLLKIQEEVRK
jgi:MinD superfamily P-loop ATPase